MKEFQKGILDNDRVITEENVQRMGEIIALTSIKTVIVRGGKNLHNLYKGLLRDINRADDDMSRYSDGYEIAQETMLFLCKHTGKRLDDVLITKIGRKTTIKQVAFSVADRYLAKSFVSPMLNTTSLNEQIMTEPKTILDDEQKDDYMIQQRWSSVSYKNHKRYKKDESEWIVIQNTHEPIISQELWDKVREREKSVAQGRKTKRGYTHPLSGFLYCADCGGKLKMSCVARNEKAYLNFNCGNHMRLGKSCCFSHFIQANTLERIVLEDIREMAQRIVIDEKTVREEFLRHNRELEEKAMQIAKKNLQSKRKRAEELSRLMQLAYEDRLKGKMPEDICIDFIEKYSEERKTLTAEMQTIEEKLSETESTRQTADDFIRDIKKYLNAPELTREMCYELIDRIVIGGLPKITGKEREIDIVYKIDIASVLRHKLQ